MDQRNGKTIWENPTDKIIDQVIEEGIEILKKDHQKALKEFDDYIREILGEKEILG